MKLDITVEGLALPVKGRMLTKIHQAIHQALPETEIDPNAYAISINYRDKSYSVERGGFHPVEIGLSKSGQSWTIEYITDFAYCSGPFPELYKEADFDFASNRLYMQDYVFELTSDNARDFYDLWSSNFVEYIDMGAFDEIEVAVHS